MSFIIIKNISKSYGKSIALKDICIEINKGELFGIIGPDGAGKTTLFRLLTTLLLPDNGSITINGIDVVKDYKDIRRQVGYMPGRFSLYQDLSVQENLKFFATIFNTSVSEGYELIKPIYSQIEKFKERRAGDLSGGMKQKLALSCALIHKPKVLFLDEPTTGVDAVSRKEFWEILESLKSKVLSIIVSTPYMDEASLCDRVALIQKGEILSINQPQKIIEQYPRKLFALKASNVYHLIKSLQKYPHTHSVFPFGQYTHYVDKRNDILPLNLKNELKEMGQDNIEIKIINPNIEDCFMELMNQYEEDAL